MTTLAITGHRLGPKLGGYEPNPLGRAVQAALRAEMRRLFRLRPELQVSRVRVGMATGVDQWAGWIAYHAGIPFTAALPFDGHHVVWTPQQQAKYHQLLALASELVVVSPSTSQQRNTFGWAAGALQKRNEWMVDNSDVLLAVWDGVPKGGTWNCIQYARKVGRMIVTVDVAEIRNAVGGG